MEYYSLLLAFQHPYTFEFLRRKSQKTRWKIWNWSENQKFHISIVYILVNAPLSGHQFDNSHLGRRLSWWKQQLCLVPPRSLKMKSKEAQKSEKLKDYLEQAATYLQFIEAVRAFKLEKTTVKQDGVVNPDDHLWLYDKNLFSLIKNTDWYFVILTRLSTLIANVRC